jgi:hypothetical protein
LGQQAPTAAPSSPASVAALSRAVLRSAAAGVAGGDSESTAGLLYHGNWLPLSPQWLERFPNDTAITRFVVGDGGVARTLTENWIRTRDQHWTYWHGRRASRLTSSYKIYVSVLPDCLPEAFARTVEVLSSEATTSLKLSRWPRGLLRPDRVIAYCGTRAEAERLAVRLSATLADLPAQGVPFTASVCEHAAVSWARDVPSPAAAYAGSWRRWVTRKLAAYLHASDSASAGARAAFALARLREDGVDTDNWIPPVGRWEQR